jgi:hypothetical protein
MDNKQKENDIDLSKPTGPEVVATAIPTGPAGQNEPPIPAG